MRTPKRTSPPSTKTRRKSSAPPPPGARGWLLGCVFLRFLEDNHLVETPWLAGAGDRGKLALAARTLYFRQPGQGHFSDTDYLAHCFRRAAREPFPARNRR